MKHLERYRGIIRLSYNKDDQSRVRNRAKTILEEAGFTNTKTGLWETPDASFEQIQKQLGQFMEFLAEKAKDDSEFLLDHVWIYIDKLT